VVIVGVAMFAVNRGKVELEREPRREPNGHGQGANHAQRFDFIVMTADFSDGRAVTTDARTILMNRLLREFELNITGSEPTSRRGFHRTIRGPARCFSRIFKRHKTENE
jgi:hypothetical protein